MRLSENILKELNKSLVEKDINKPDDLWKRQMDNKSHDELKIYLDKLYKKLNDYNNNNIDIKTDAGYKLLNKINYIEDILGIKPKIGRELH